VVRFTVDVGRNRLLVELDGVVCAGEPGLSDAQLAQALPRLTAPFDVVSDVRQLEGIEPEALPALKHLGERLRAAGVRRVVRVVGKSPNGAVQMERLARHLGHAAHLAFSLDEAEAVLSAR
jgi:hypothetical protein